MLAGLSSQLASRWFFAGLCCLSAAGLSSAAKLSQAGRRARDVEAWKRDSVLMRCMKNSLRKSISRILYRSISDVDNIR